LVSDQQESLVSNQQESVVSDQPIQEQLSLNNPSCQLETIPTPDTSVPAQNIHPTTQENEEPKSSIDFIEQFDSLTESFNDVQPNNLQCFGSSVTSPNRSVVNETSPLFQSFDSVPPLTSLFQTDILPPAYQDPMPTVYQNSNPPVYRNPTSTLPNPDIINQQVACQPSFYQTPNQPPVQQPPPPLTSQFISNNLQQQSQSSQFIPNNLQPPNSEETNQKECRFISYTGYPTPTHTFNDTVERMPDNNLPPDYWTSMSCTVDLTNCPLFCCHVRAHQEIMEGSTDWKIPYGPPLQGSQPCSCCKNAS